MLAILISSIGRVTYGGRVWSLGEAQKKLALLRLADELGNAAEACRELGYSRDSYYRYRRIYETEGVDGLRGTSRSKPNTKNRISTELEDAIIEIAIENPSLSRDGIRATLQHREIAISSSGIGNALRRHGLARKEERFAALERRHSQRLASEPMAQLVGEISSLHRRVAELEGRIDRAPSLRHPRRRKASPHSVPPAMPSKGGLLKEIFGDSWPDAFPVSQLAHNKDEVAMTQDVAAPSRVSQVLSALFGRASPAFLVRELHEFDHLIGMPRRSAYGDNDGELQDGKKT